MPTRTNAIAVVCCAGLARPSVMAIDLSALLDVLALAVFRGLRGAANPPPAQSASTKPA
jgi:hypothetical protein